MTHGSQQGRASHGDLRVFLVAPDLRTRGGFELQMSLLASGLARSGVEVDVFVRQQVDRSHPYLRSMESDGVRVHSPSPKLAALLDAPARHGQRALNALLVLLRPFLVLLAAGDALVRGRSYARSLVGVHGAARRLLSIPAGWDGLTWWSHHRMDWVRRRREPGVVDVQHSMIPSGVAYAVKRGLPVVYTEYGAPDEAMASVWLGLAPVINSADHIIGRANASISGLERLCGLDPARPVTIVPNAVTATPPSAALPGASAVLQAADATNVLVIGRLARSKGSDVVLEAFSRIAANHEHVRFIMAGDGPLRPMLEQRASDLGLHERVSFVGEFDDAGVFLRVADVVVHPTLNDGRSVAVLEAMAWGRPVVASNVGGVSELVSDGVTGVLVPPGDPVALADAVSKLIADRGMRERLGSAARSWFLEGEFTPEAMVAKTVAVYRGVARVRFADGGCDDRLCTEGLKYVRGQRAQG